MDKLDWFSRGKTASGLVLLVLSGTLSAGLPAAADEHGLEVSDAYMQTTIPSRPAAGYFTLKNNGDVDRVLVGASSPGCEFDHDAQKQIGRRHGENVDGRQRSSSGAPKRRLRTWRFPSDVHVSRRINEARQFGSGDADIRGRHLTQKRLSGPPSRGE